MRTIGDRWEEVRGNSSGFDYLRIGLATSVVLWHSYPLSYGRPAAEAAWNGAAGIIIQVILPCFFALSGFLVASSKLRTPHLGTFLTLRVIRLFPALAVEVTLSAIVLGAALTTLPLASYFTQRQFFSYFANVVGWIHYTLPGVFLTNPYPDTVNGSLWTLPFELESYILLSVISFLGAFRRGVLLLSLFAIATIAFAAFQFYYHGISDAPAGAGNGKILVLCFFAALLLFVYRQSIPLNAPTALVSAIVSVVLLRNELLAYVAPLPVAYLTIYIGTLNPRRTGVVSSGDYSYGIYVYAFPIQQAVASFLGDASSWIFNVSISLPIIIVSACFSWHFVERPFQELKKALKCASHPTIRHGWARGGEGSDDFAR